MRKAVTDMSGIESGDFPRLQARYRRQWWIWFAGCAVLTLVGVLAAGVYGIGMAVLSLIALPVVSAQLSKKLSRYYKSEIVPQFVGRFCDEGRYVPGAGIDEEVFRASNLFGAPPDRYATEDLIEGRVGKTVFRFAEVHAQERPTTHSKNRPPTTGVDYFPGVLFRCGFQ